MKIRRTFSAGLLFLILAIAALSFTNVHAQKKPKDSETTSDSLKSKTFSGLKWRSIGPAFTSGRIADFAVNQENNKEYYVAVASGHVWKTTNTGTTFEPVFDDYGAYSIGG